MSPSVAPDVELRHFGGREKWHSFWRYWLSAPHEEQPSTGDHLRHRESEAAERRPLQKFATTLLGGVECPSALTIIVIVVVDIANLSASLYRFRGFFSHFQPNFRSGSENLHHQGLELLSKCVGVLRLSFSCDRAIQQRSCCRENSACHLTNSNPIPRSVLALNIRLFHLHRDLQRHLSNLHLELVFLTLSALPRTAEVASKPTTAREKGSPWLAPSDSVKCCAQNFNFCFYFQPIVEGVLVISRSGPCCRSPKTTVMGDRHQPHFDRNDTYHLTRYDDAQNSSGVSYSSAVCVDSNAHFFSTHVPGDLASVSNRSLGEHRSTPWREYNAAGGVVPQNIVQASDSATAGSDEQYGPNFLSSHHEHPGQEVNSQPYTMSQSYYPSSARLSPSDLLPPPRNPVEQGGMQLLNCEGPWSQWNLHSTYTLSNEFGVPGTSEGGYLIGTKRSTPSSAMLFEPEEMAATSPSLDQNEMRTMTVDMAAIRIGKAAFGNVLQPVDILPTDSGPLMSVDNRLSPQNKCDGYHSRGQFKSSFDQGYDNEGFEGRSPPAETNYDHLVVPHTQASSSVHSSSAASEPVPMSPSFPGLLFCEVEGCRKKFNGIYRKGNLARHRKTQHGGAFGSKRTFPCEEDYCKKDFCRKDSRLKHYRTHHPRLATRLINRKPQRP
ncbi:uncharacterized protein BDR25DRAFT_313335 [Lindgomyces ingoldianus]|uniref:Uncharacterized protein n=1 Tax=Lindgomyces ingoldianus TaxID=673940 RepID=A0ACB6QYR3_9PLEO|nr:uncharacterized protein BDR25DRAFT_313335 [Lindgomyces ingoldianus]KAF2472158.1 hypothetical protein BDR25DRAFT_313335 [Lindgomyces ingoldianus]